VRNGKRKTNKDNNRHAVALKAVWERWRGRRVVEWIGRMQAAVEVATQRSGGALALL
jgi:hypothetical protein